MNKDNSIILGLVLSLVIVLVGMKLGYKQLTIVENQEAIIKEQTQASFERNETMLMLAHIHQDIEILMGIPSFENIFQSPSQWEEIPLYQIPFSDESGE